MICETLRINTTLTKLSLRSDVIEIKEQNPDDYVRLNNGITQEMMGPDYWIGLRDNSDVDTDETILSLAQIDRLNYLNTQMQMMY